MFANMIESMCSIFPTRVSCVVAFLLFLFGPTQVLADTSDAEKAYDGGNYLKALELWLPLAEDGDISAQYNVATLYRMGSGVLANLVVSAGWYRRAAEQGHARSQVNLGRLYLEGRGVERDVFQALSWFQKAADSDDSFGHYFLGRQYMRGVGVPQNYRQAASFFRHSAEQ